MSDNTFNVLRVEATWRIDRVLFSDGNVLDVYTNMTDTGRIRDLALTHAADLWGKDTRVVVGLAAITTASVVAKASGASADMQSKEG
jgi:K+-transporting ATPase A subunit